MPKDDRAWYVFTNKNGNDGKRIKFGGYDTKDLPQMWVDWNKQKEKFVRLLIQGIIKENDFASASIERTLFKNIRAAEKSRKLPPKNLTGMTSGQLQQYYNEIGLFDDSVFVNGRWGGTPLKESGEISPLKISNSERKRIGLAFKKAGLDGNGRFEKKEHGLQAITNALSSLGFQLDMVSADTIMGDKGNRNLIFRRANSVGDDPFSEKSEIQNSRISFNWERLDGPTHQYPNSPSKFEVLAYAS